MDKKIELEDLGYEDFIEKARIDLGLAEFSVARVIAEYKGAYRVKNSEGEYLAKITGKQMHEAQKREDYPAVGDWVAITELPDEDAVIRGVLPRRTTLAKKYSDKQDIQIIAANIDVAFIVEAVDGDFNINRLERYLVLTNEGKIQPVVVLNKTDLISQSELEAKIAQVKERFNDLQIICSSTVNESGLSDIYNHIAKGKTYCFLGSSGVGKSTIINKLLGKEAIKTGDVNAYTEKGRHTTTTREMYFLENGGIVIDNPGTREVGIADADMGMANVFDEIGQLSVECKFANCSHLHEPGCAVLEAVKQEKLNPDKYDNYIKMKKEADFYSMSDIEKREKDRQFGKFVKKYHDSLKDD